MKEGIFTHRQQHPLQRIRANETCAFRKREKERKKEREKEGRERRERDERGISSSSKNEQQLLLFS